MEIILNVSGKPSDKFSLPQRKASHGYLVFDVPVEDIVQFLVCYDKSIKVVAKVLVDASPKNYELNNDILNSVLPPCKVCSLNVEINPDSDMYEFMEYDPDDL